MVVKNSNQPALAPWRQRVLFRRAVLFGSSGLLLAPLLPILNYLFIWDERSLRRLLIFLSIALILCGIAIFLLTRDQYKTFRREILHHTLIATPIVVVGVALQGLLLLGLSHPYALSRSERLLSQFGMIYLALGLVFWLARMPGKERNTWMMVIITTTGIFLFQFPLLTQRLWMYQPKIALFAPCLILGAPFLVNEVQRLIAWLDRNLKNRSVTVGWIIVMLALTLSGIIYFRAALQHAQRVNTSFTYGDQEPYVAIARQARAYHFRYTGNHNQMPLYPFLQALFLKPGDTQLEFFEQGKLRNIILSLVVLAALMIIFLKYFPLFQSLLLTLMVAFSLFIFKAPYFQVEVWFYFVTFLGYLLMVRMLVKPDWRFAIATGVMIGLAYLSKASVLPGLVLFVAISTIQCVVIWVKRRDDPAFSWKDGAGRLLLTLLVLVTFVIITLPYGWSMQKRFGNYFYNLNTTMYIWYDSFDEAAMANLQYDFQSKRVDFPVGERPGLLKYLREHSPSRIFERINYGLEAQVSNIFYSYNATNYILSYFLIFLMVSAMQLKVSMRLVRQSPFPVGFSFVYFVINLLAISWYSYISASPRFVQGLFVSLLFSIVYAIQAIIHSQPASETEVNSRLDLPKYLGAMNILLAITLLYNIWWVTKLLLPGGLYYS